MQGGLESEWGDESLWCLKDRLLGRGGKEGGRQEEALPGNPVHCVLADSRAAAGAGLALVIPSGPAALA